MRLVSLAVGLVALASAPARAWAYHDGRITGRSATGCGTATSCHGTNPGATAELTGPASVLAGSRQAFTLTLRSTRAGFMAGGLDVTARGPAGAALNASQTGTRINSGELVMNAPILATGGTVTVRFDLVAPADAGAVSLQAAGNAVNLSGDATGDAWALAALQVNVTAAAADASAPVDVFTRDASAADVPAAAGDGGDEFEQFDPTASYGYGRCSATPRSGAGLPSLACVLAMTLAWSLRRMRRERPTLATSVAVCVALSWALADCSDEPTRLPQRENVDLASAARCVRGEYWARGDRGDNHMHPGRDCIGCHTRSGRGPRFTVAGTLFNAPHEEDDCFGYNSDTSVNRAAEVEVTDASGRPFYIIANRAGNFYTTHAFRRPLRRVRVFSPAGAVVEMGSPPPHGDCNACHSRVGTVTPTGESPGRVVVPR